MSKEYILNFLNCVDKAQKNAASSGGVLTNGGVRIAILCLTFLLNGLMLVEKYYIGSIIYTLVVVSILIFSFIIKRQQLKRCVLDGLLFGNGAFMFSIGSFVSIKADWKFILGVIIGYIITALAQYLILQRKIKQNFFEKCGKSGQMSGVHFAIIAVCSLLGSIMAPLLSWVVSEDMLLHVILWLCLLLSMFFISMFVYNLMAVYYLIKYPQNN